jgi:acyl-CoA hydrolase
MGPRRISPADLASALPPGGLTLVSSCCAESDLLADMVRRTGDALGDMRFSGIFVPGLNRQTWQGGGQTRVLTFFQTPELREQAARTDFLPLSYGQIQRYYRETTPAAVLFMCSPPDEDGNCSFGPETAFIPDHWRNAAIRIAHINPSLPRTAGDHGIPFKEITAYIEADQPLKGMQAGSPDEISTAIACHVAPYIDDGATLQTGLGKIPDAVLDTLTNRRNLRIHSGLIGDGVLRLVRSGAMAAGQSAVVGVAIGSPDLYAGLANSHFEFRPVSITHDIRLAGAADHLVTINSALQADLFGQCYAEVGPAGAMSGPGGASDFAAAAQLSRRGIRIVAFPATAAKGRISRIAAPSDTNGPVSLGRMDVDIVATEHGAADLRGLSYDARAEALIGIAAPEHQQNLLSQWAAISDKL